MLNIRTLKSIIFYTVCLLLPQYVTAEQQTNLNDKAQYIQLQTASKKSFRTYIAGPQHAKHAILLIHGWWGLNSDIETWANEFAVSGYRVMAIDLYNQQVTTDPEKAKQLMKSVNQSIADEQYAAAIKHLSASGRKVAIMGRSYGASQVFHAALVGRDKVSAAVVYYPYGQLILDTNTLASIKTPILGHFARKDFFLKPEKLSQFTSAINKSGLLMTFNIYEARHGFDNPTGSNFDAAAHKLSQQRTREFLDKYLN